MVIHKKIINKLLMKSALSRIPNDKREIYLTFDDGPEPGITEFVLEELKKYQFKATFFCTGHNAEMHPDLMQRIVKDGHAVGNHTYSHKKAYDISVPQYVNDVDKADNFIHTHIFRPPNGSLTLGSWLRLKKKYKIIFWSIDSMDWRKEKYDYNKSMEELKKTQSGDIILFHFSNKLGNGTQELLPDYLSWLRNNSFRTRLFDDNML